MKRAQWIVLMIAVPAVIVAGLFLGRALNADSETTSVRIDTAENTGTYRHQYTIPLGTGDRIAAGEQIEIIPRELEVQVGDAIRIVNDDDQDHIVGVFFVGSGETLTQRFTSPGVLEGECSVHPSGAFTLRVVA